MEKILVRLDFRWLSFDNEYRLTSNVFEWGFHVLPQKGDLLNFEDFEMVGYEEKENKSYKAINGNLFAFHHKLFTEFEGKKIIELAFGNWDD